MRRKSNVWNEVDIARLSALVASGATANRASAALNRPKASVQARARLLGMSFPSMIAQRLRVREMTGPPLPRGTTVAYHPAIGRDKLVTGRASFLSD
jgi:hypothetical protein